MSETYIYHYKPKLKRHSIEWKYGESSKEKNSGAGATKEGHADNGLRHERTHH